MVFSQLAHTSCLIYLSTTVQQLPASRFCSVPEATQVFTALLVQPRALRGPQPGSILGQQSSGIFLFSLLYMTPRCVPVEKGHLWSNTLNTDSEYIYSIPGCLLVPQNWNPHQHQAGNSLLFNVVSCPVNAHCWPAFKGCKKHLCRCLGLMDVFPEASTHVHAHPHPTLPPNTFSPLG